MLTGAVMMAVFAKEPEALSLTVAEAVYVSVPPPRRFTVSLMCPVPLDVQVEPVDGEQVQWTLERPGGNVSATLAPLTIAVLGLLTVIWYVTVCPSSTEVKLSVFAIDRSAGVGCTTVVVTNGPALLG